MLPPHRPAPQPDRARPRRYLNLLEASYQLVRLSPYSVNRTKRLIKSPKLYWCDTGLALHLARVPSPAGPHLENLLLQDLVAWRAVHLDEPQLHYWRTSTGAEVDFVIEHGHRLLPIEVKAGARPRIADARHLELLLDEYPDHAAAGLLLHTGAHAHWLTDRVLAAPWFWI